MDPIFLDWAFKAIISGAVVYAVRILSALQKSTENLNIRVAVVIEKVSGHDKTLDRHDERLQNLEQGE